MVTFRDKERKSLLNRVNINKKTSTVMIDSGSDLSNT